MNTCQIQQTNKMLKFVPANNSSLKVNQLGNAMSDPTAFKVPQVPSSVLAALGLYNQSFKILNAVEPSVALSNYYLESALALCI